MSPTSDFLVADRRRRRANHDGALPPVYLVAAVAANGVIGANGKLPWHIPEDTLGHPVIMGRRTWQSLAKPLPGRLNIVVTRDRGFTAEGAAVVHSLRDALARAKGARAAMVIGGAALFAEALPAAEGLLLTEIQRDYAGDTRFPAWDRGAWREAKREPATAADGTRLDFVLYEPA